MSENRDEMRPASRAGDRSGTAVLVLVLILALVVGTFAASITRGALHERTRESHRLSIAQLESAIDSVERSGIPDGTSIRLPLDPSDQRWVRVTSEVGAGGQRQWVATHVSTDRPGLFIRRERRSDQ